MTWHKQIWNTLRRTRLDREVNRELSFHLQERIDDLRQTGLSEADARIRASRELGGFTAHAERTADEDVLRWLDESIRNLSLAVRSLARTPALTATVVLTLAIGIGANSAVFSAVDAVLLQPDARRRRTVRAARCRVGLTSAGDPCVASGADACAARRWIATRGLTRSSARCYDSARARSSTMDRDGPAGRALYRDDGLSCESARSPGA